MRIFTQIYFAALTLFGLLSQEYVFAANESNQFSTYLFGCYESAEEKDSDENNSIFKQDFHQPKIGSGGADEEEYSFFHPSGLIAQESVLVSSLPETHSSSEGFRAYRNAWLRSYHRPDLLAFLGTRKLFA